MLTGSLMRSPPRGVTSWKYTDAWNQYQRAEVSCVDQHDDRDNDLIHFDHEAETCQSTEASADEDTCDCDCYVTQL